MKKSRKLSAAKVSVGINAFFIILKVAVALASGSIGILAEALHSLLDLFASVFAYLGIKKAEQPFDKTHPYGHEKFENLSSIIQMALIAITAVVISYEASKKLFGPHEIQYEEYGILLMLATTVGAFYVSRYLHRIGKEEHSHALEADAYHFTTDVWSSIAVMVGLVFAKLGFVQADALAALAVALIMLKLSVETGMKMLDILLEHSAEENVIKQVQSIIRQDRNVVRFHKLRARHIGAKVWVDVHVHLKRKTSLPKAHSIAHKLKDRIMRQMSKIKEVNIHIEPD